VLNCGLRAPSTPLFHRTMASKAKRLDVLNNRVKLNYILGLEAGEVESRKAKMEK
jgi:hypothetical protein